MINSMMNSTIKKLVTGLCISLLLVTSAPVYSVVKKPTKAVQKPIKKAPAAPVKTPQKPLVNKNKPGAKVQPQPSKKPVTPPTRIPANNLEEQALKWWNSFKQTPSMSWKCAALKLSNLLGTQAKYAPLAATLKKLSAEKDLLKVLDAMKKHQAALPTKLKNELEKQAGDATKQLALLDFFQKRIELKNGKC